MMDGYMLFNRTKIVKSICEKFVLEIGKSLILILYDKKVFVLFSKLFLWDRFILFFKE